MITNQPKSCGRMTVYCGRRIHMDARKQLDPSRRVWRNGADWQPPVWIDEEVLLASEFDWGSTNDGARALAMSLLADAVRTRVAWVVAWSPFLDQVVSKLPDVWVLTSHEVRAWLEAYREADNMGGKHG